MPNAYSTELLGLINDDSTHVGSVHLGVAVRVTVGEGEVRVRETETMEGAFASRVELLAERYRYETWSTFLLDTAVSLLPAEARPLDA